MFKINSEFRAPAALFDAFFVSPPLPAYGKYAFGRESKTRRNVFGLLGRSGY